MDPYKELGIPRSATEKEIKNAYRKLAIKHHPDKGGDPEKFKQIAAAYETLTNKDKKNIYDQFGSVNRDIDPMDIFRQFSQMNSSFFIDPSNITTHQFSGFNNGMFDNLFTSMSNMNNCGGNSFSQTTTIINGVKKTVTNKNGKITETLETLEPTNLNKLS
jgi:DnaJ-class molecular chaperone